MHIAEGGQVVIVKKSDGSQGKLSQSCSSIKPHEELLYMSRNWQANNREISSGKKASQAKLSATHKSSFTNFTRQSQLFKIEKSYSG